MIPILAECEPRGGMVGDGGTRSRRDACGCAQRLKQVVATPTERPGDAPAAAAPQPEKSARAILQANYEALQSMARRLRGEDANELVNEVSVHVLSNPAGLESAKRPLAWLRTVMRNLFIDQLRYRVRHPVDCTINEDLCAGRGPSPEVLALGAQVEQALARLKRRHRDVLILKEVEGMTYREIAENLGVSESSVPSLLHRARQRLRALLSEASP